MSLRNFTPSGGVPSTSEQSAEVPTSEQIAAALVADAEQPRCCMCSDRVSLNQQASGYTVTLCKRCARQSSKD